MQALPTVWDDESVDWTGFDAIVIRSTWDYHRRRDEFLGWLERARKATTVWNPPELVRWNSHKSYLVDLSTRGAAIVPTELIPQGSDRPVRSVLDARGWPAVVIKPAVGADGEGLRIVDRGGMTVGERHFRSLLAKGDVLVQPLLERVRVAGERSLVFFDGRFSHAVSHPFVLEGGSRAGKPATQDARTRGDAARIVAGLSRKPLYARVDLLPSDEGRWLVSELELIEPDLYLRTDPGAAGRFAEALLEKLR